MNKRVSQMWVLLAACREVMRDQTAKAAICFWNIFDGGVLLR